MFGAMCFGFRSGKQHQLLSICKRSGNKLVCVCGECMHDFSNITKGFVLGFSRSDNKKAKLAFNGICWCRSRFGPLGQHLARRYGPTPQSNLGFGPLTKLGENCYHK